MKVTRRRGRTSACVCVDVVPCPGVGDWIPGVTSGRCPTAGLRMELGQINMMISNDQAKSDTRSGRSFTASSSTKFALTRYLLLHSVMERKINFLLRITQY